MNSIKNINIVANGKLNSDLSRFGFIDLQSAMMASQVKEYLMLSHLHMAQFIICISN